MPKKKHIIGLLLGLMFIGCSSSVGYYLHQSVLQQGLDAGDDEDLADAIFLYKRSYSEKLRAATDANERFETLLGDAYLQLLFAEGHMAFIFDLGDEGFEAEHDYLGGFGLGQRVNLAGAPAMNRRIHEGELGGPDASSCRACHFSGGPDGAGTSTQKAFFRGHDQMIDSAIARDAPHVMGLGYIQLLAREMDTSFQIARDLALEEAQLTGEAVRRQLKYKDIDFGFITAKPDGALDTSELTAISEDLKVRPFGHKGRHTDLTSLVDEALQIHLGLQTASRLYRQRADAETYLGGGPEDDPDGDGVSDEAQSAVSVLLAGYLSMLGTPVVKPPLSTPFVGYWQEGFENFKTIGCADCHVPEHRLGHTEVNLRAELEEAWEVSVNLQEHGQAPQPTQVDFGADDQGETLGGTPIYPFTDLRRHDMGDALADPKDEALPDGANDVPASFWLTRSLWGLADTAPYLHDGRATTVEEAILAHGGEAQAAKEAYENLNEEERGKVRLFLMSLTREPVVLVE